MTEGNSQLESLCQSLRAVTINTAENLNLKCENCGISAAAQQPQKDSDSDDDEVPQNDTCKKCHQRLVSTDCLGRTEKIPAADNHRDNAQDKNCEEAEGVVKQVRFKLDSDPPGKNILDAASQDMFPFLLPGLCHLTAEDTPRGVLAGLQLPQLAAEYFHYQLCRYQLSSALHTDNKEIEVTNARYASPSETGLKV